MRVAGMSRVVLATGISLGPCPWSYIGSPPYYGMRCASFLALVCDLNFNSIRATMQATPPHCFSRSRNTTQQEKIRYFRLSIRHQNK